ncbi:hypothetical protein FACS1894147_06810 [Spirochaetia bacterium]|nr:hypothetical protein FACS1894147_06810 [Spirochaetia bacterium]
MAKFVKTIFGIFIVMGIFGCAGFASTNTAPIERAINKAIGTVISTLSKEGIIAIINISSDDSEVSEFIAGEAEYILVKKGYTLVDRNQLDKVRQEQNFQLSGDVDDSSVVSMGKFAGAKIVITGAITGSGSMRRFRLRALDTETARVLGAASEALPDRTVSRQTSATTSANTAAYRIGDRGPAGGIIFYDKGTFTDGWRYLEAAPAETEFTAQWGEYPDSGAWTNQLEDIGRGALNTLNLKYNHGPGYKRAGELCYDLKYNEYNDWFLPSIGELDLMYKNLKQKGLGSFGNNYWSSSVVEKGYRIYYLNFNTGDWSHGLQTNTLSVRAVRSF